MACAARLWRCSWPSRSCGQDLRSRPNYRRRCRQLKAESGRLTPSSDLAPPAQRQSALHQDLHQKPEFPRKPADFYEWAYKAVTSEHEGEGLRDRRLPAVVGPNERGQRLEIKFPGVDASETSNLKLADVHVDVVIRSGSRRKSALRTGCPLVRNQPAAK